MNWRLRTFLRRFVSHVSFCKSTCASYTVSTTCVSASYTVSTTCVSDAVSTTCVSDAVSTTCVSDAAVSTNKCPNTINARGAAGHANNST